MWASTAGGGVLWFRKEVDPFPFTSLVKSVLREQKISTSDDDPVKFAASRSITLIPKTPGKVYDHHCSNVFLYGITDPGKISNIEAAVRRQTKGRLQHKAKLTFLLSQERQEVIKVCRFP